MERNEPQVAISIKWRGTKPVRVKQWAPSWAACAWTLNPDLDYREPEGLCEPLRPLDTRSNFQVKGVFEEGALEKLRYQQPGRRILVSMFLGIEPTTTLFVITPWPGLWQTLSTLISLGVHGRCNFRGHPSEVWKHCSSTYSGRTPGYNPRCKISFPDSITLAALS